MDLNELLFHHQVALIRDEAPASGTASLTGHYARRIRMMRRRLGVLPWGVATPAGLPSVGPAFG